MLTRRPGGCRLRPAFVVLLLLLPCAGARAAGATATAAERWLRGRIAQLAADPRLDGARVGVAVAELSGGRVIAEHDGSAPVSIASNAKLFTTAAALSYLGPEYRFRTEIYAGRRRGERVMGELYVKGRGDPSLREQTLWRIARDIHKAGIRRVSGGLTIDESYLDDRRLPPLFETRDTDAYYRPAVGALSLEENVVWVGVQPAARAGQPATILIAPQSAHVQVKGEVATVGGRRRSRIQLRSEQRSDQTVLLLSGRVRRRSAVVWQRKRVVDPGLYFATTLHRLLQQSGVSLGRTAIRRARVPRRAARVLVHRSQPLASIVSQMNKSSSNAMAELLLKVLGAERFGRPGSTSDGLRAVRRYVTRIGITPREYLLRNGSGLYEATRFTPRQVVQLLRGVYRSFRIGSEFVASLPIAGLDGTLKRRYLGTGAEGYVRAKTGTLARVVALSGYAGAMRGAPVAFSIILTELPPGAIRRARAVADEMAHAMVTYLEQLEVR